VIEGNASKRRFSSRYRKYRGAECLFAVISPRRFVIVRVKGIEALQGADPELRTKLLEFRKKLMDEAAENGLVADNEELETGKDLIDIVNEYGKNRGKFKKGSNKNPVTGTGGKQKTEKPVEEPVENEPEKEEVKDTDKSSEENTEE
jgi:hypothetical protein